MLNRFLQRLAMLGIRWLIRNDKIDVQVEWAPDLLMALVSASNYAPFRAGGIEAVEANHGDVLLHINMGKEVGGAALVERVTCAEQVERENQMHQQLAYDLTIIKPDGIQRSYRMTADDVVEFVTGCDKAFAEDTGFEPDDVFTAPLTEDVAE